MHDEGVSLSKVEPEFWWSEVNVRLPEVRLVDIIVSSSITEEEIMKKWIVLALLVIVGCDFDSRKFTSAQHCLPSSESRFN